MIAKKSVTGNALRPNDSVYRPARFPLVRPAGRILPSQPAPELDLHRPHFELATPMGWERHPGAMQSPTFEGTT